MSPIAPRPPYDAELYEVLKTFPPCPILTLETLPADRDETNTMCMPEAVLTDPAITHRETTIKGLESDLQVSILEFKYTAGGKRPAIYYIHGGSMISGSRLFGVGLTFDWIKQLDAVVVSIEYRLAPEHPDPAAIDDCYAGLKWVVENPSELGIDPDRILVAGGSAGGGLSAGIALLARDRGAPKLAGQCLIYPMLDDHMISTSSQQYMENEILAGQVNIAAWDWYLNGHRAEENVSIYAAPSRATDLRGSPPAWIDVGSAELFRDEDVAYATRLWAQGVQVELHVWPGAFHAFDILAPGSALTKRCLETRLAWVKRILSSTGE